MRYIENNRRVKEAKLTYPTEDEIIDFLDFNFAKRKGLPSEGRDAVYDNGFMKVVVAPTYLMVVTVSSKGNTNFQIDIEDIAEMYKDGMGTVWVEGKNGTVYRFLFK